MSIKPYYDRDGITIYHGDCREIVPQLGRFDLLLTDPPYGINADQMTMGKCQSNKPKERRFDKSMDWDNAKPDLSKIKDYAPLACVWGGNYFADVLPPTNDWLIWHKQNDGRSFSECEMAWTNFGRQTRHISWNWLHGGETKLHPTQKPLKVMRWCIRMAGQVSSVLDPFMGGGTTLVAAKELGIRAVGIELNKRYCEIAVKRLAQGVLNFSGADCE